MPKKKQKAQHTHKYQKVVWGKNKTVIFRCVLEGCPHYCHPEMVIGRESLCHDCGVKFIMTKEHLERVKPKCASCRGEISVTAEPPVVAAEGFNDLLDRLHDDSATTKD